MTSLPLFPEGGDRWAFLFIMESGEESRFLLLDSWEEEEEEEGE